MVTEKVFMNTQLDFYFPYFVLSYGLIMVLATGLPQLQKKAAETLDPELLQWFQSHKLLGQVCFWVGGLWSLQRLFFLG